MTISVIKEHLSSHPSILIITATFLIVLIVLLCWKRDKKQSVYLLHQNFNINRSVSLLSPSENITSQRTNENANITLRNGNNNISSHNLNISNSSQQLSDITDEILRIQDDLEAFLEAIDVEKKNNLKKEMRTETCCSTSNNCRNNF